MKQSETIKKTASAFRQMEEWDYWREKLNGRLVRSVFPYDLKSADQTGGAHCIEPMEISPEVSAQLLALSNRSDYRLYWRCWRS